jgi:TonB family protein
MLLGLAQRAVRSDRIVAMVGTTALASRIERILAEGKSPPVGRAKTLLLVGALLPIIGIVASIEAVTTRTEDGPDQSSSGVLNGGSSDGAVAAASSAGHVVLPKSNPSRPLSIPVYPPISRRSGEHGTVVLSLQVLEDGSVANATIHESSGHPDLDHAAMDESYRWQLDPGTVDGVPASMWGRFAVTFKLSI